MTIHHTPEQIRQRYVDVMGERLGELYYVLWNEIAWVHTIWEEYVILFGTNQKRIDILNRAAQSHFYLTGTMMWEQVILNVTRLTDQAVKGDLERLTLRQLPKLVTDNDLRRAISKAINRADEKAKFCRDWRNRHIAHRNLALALERESVRPLELGSCEKMEEAIEAITEVIDIVTNHYDQPRIPFGGSISFGAEHLLYILDDWLDVKQKRREQAERGEIPQNRPRRPKI